MKSYQYNKSLQLGFTLVELLIGLSITMILVGLATNYIFSAWGVQSVVEVETQAKTYSEQALSRVSLELSQSRRLFSQDAAGIAYVARLNLSGAPKAITGSKLPLVRVTGSMSPEKNCEISPTEYILPYSVGNSLLFAELRDNVKLTSGNPVGVTYYRNLDIYRFNYVYVSDYQNAPGKQPSRFSYWPQGTPKLTQYLVEWRSVPFVDHKQLTDLFARMVADGNAAQRGLLAQHLASKNILYAWDSSQNNPTNAFYNINASTGALTNMLSSVGARIPMQGTENVLRTGSGNKFSIAYNTNKNAAEPGYYPVRQQVPFYYKPTLDASLTCPQVATPLPTASPAQNYDFPRGFEVMIVGPQSGRSVLMHLSVNGKGYNNRMVEQSHSVITYARDL